MKYFSRLAVFEKRVVRGIFGSKRECTRRMENIED
jgi:hypothetical protein